MSRKMLIYQYHRPMIYNLYRVRIIRDTILNKKDQTQIRKFNLLIQNPAYCSLISMFELYSKDLLFIIRLT